MSARRRFIRAVVAMPVIGGLLAVLSPFLRYLKPDNKPYELPLAASDAAKGGPQVVGSTRDLKEPWDFFYFTYVQKYVQYDAAGSKATNIPGVAIRLPQKVKFANLQGYEGHPGETDIVLYGSARILGVSTILNRTGTTSRSATGGSLLPNGNNMRCWPARAISAFTTRSIPAIPGRSSPDRRPGGPGTFDLRSGGRTSS